MKISIIGFGNMAKAMAQGLLHDKSNQLSAAAPSLTIGVNVWGIKTHSDNLAIIADANVIILAVKPAQMQAVLKQVSPALPAGCLIISVASGLNLAWYAQHLSPNSPLVRAMPNIGASLGQSATPLMANQYVTDEQKALANQLFTQMGITTWIEDESLINAFTALSGSGPAYVFLFMEAIANAAIALGLSKDIATSFTLQTVQGALSLALKREASLGELRTAVTSPAGTTAAAIKVFEDREFDQLIYDAMLAACTRAIELGRN